MQLHEEENTKGKLICSLLPQKGPYNLSMGKQLNLSAISGITTNFFFVENFLADSDADSNGHKDAIQNKDEKKDNKGLSVAFDPSAGPPEEASQGKVCMKLSRLSKYRMHVILMIHTYFCALQCIF